MLRSRSNAVGIWPSKGGMDPVDIRSLLIVYLYIGLHEHAACIIKHTYHSLMPGIMFTFKHLVKKKIFQTHVRTFCRLSPSEPVAWMLQTVSIH